ncbi:DUF547 domain-containing protein [Dyadobacter tibetensis]|uniref:DUF547 domain-containing protein n=1 Tax=Dyadobacter tibetensis TaxID=1211851 RepID=UPI0004B77CF4|nr:DUF547 domain-containing protein [Dyadobacter tibetensis]
MNIRYFLLKFLILLYCSGHGTVLMGQNLLRDSEELLMAVKMELPVNDLVARFEGVDADLLEEQLIMDDDRKVFWINVYNAFFQILAREGLVAPAIFTEKNFTIASVPLSLDEVEHGILRRYRAKWSRGYLPRFCVAPLIKKWAVDTLDYRIHFALNCGAKSCPPIGFYTQNKIDQQLDIAMLTFLKSETSINLENKTVRTSRLLQWYRHDFKGRRGILRLLSSVLEKDLTGYRLSYSDYDWTQQLANYRP